MSRPAPEVEIDVTDAGTYDNRVALDRPLMFQYSARFHPLELMLVLFLILCYDLYWLSGALECH